MGGTLSQGVGSSVTDQEAVDLFEKVIVVVKELRKRKADLKLSGTVPVVLRIPDSLMAECIGYIERLAKVKVIIEFVGDKE